MSDYRQLEADVAAVQAEERYDRTRADTVEARRRREAQQRLERALRFIRKRKS